LQELFGPSNTHPSIAQGRGAAGAGNCLSPAHRPVQVTRDLPGFFWRGSYAAVRFRTCAGATRGIPGPRIRPVPRRPGRVEAAGDVKRHPEVPAALAVSLEGWVFAQSPSSFEARKEARTFKDDDAGVNASLILFRQKWQPSPPPLVRGFARDVVISGASQPSVA